MARVTKNNFLSGTINNLVFRNLNGVQVVQSKASKVRQTQKPKQVATNLGHVALGLNYCGKT